MFGDFFDAKLTMISVPTIIAEVNHLESLWFNGVNEKLFFDRGALYVALLGSRLKAKLAARFHVFKHRKRYKGFGLKLAYKTMKAGIRHYKNKTFQKEIR